MGTVTFDGTRVNGAGDGNTTTGFTAWGATVTAEPDYYYTNGYCISVQVKTAEVGFYCTGSSVNFTSPARVWLAKVIQTNYTAIDGLGLQLFLGNSTTAHYRYEIFSATTYPAVGGFQIIPIDPNVASYRTQTVGSPDLTTLTFYGIKSDANATAKAPNLGMDAVDYITSGTGLTITGASSSFTDFVTFDEGTSTNRYGIVTTREGIIYITGVLTIGTPISSVSFSDTNRTIVFPGGRFNTGFCGIDLDLSNASTTVALTAITMIGRGTSGAADTRPDFGTTGTSGSATIDASIFTNFRSITFTSVVSVTDSTFNSCASLTQSSSSISGCVFDAPAVASASSFLTCNNPTEITNNSFVSSGTGHAIVLTSATAGNTYTFEGNTFTGYGATGSNDAAIFNDSGGAVTLNITGGVASPTYRNGTGASTTINNNVSITVIVVDGNGEPIPGVEVAIFQDNTARTVLLSPTETDELGQASTSAAASTGPIIIRARQSTNRASFNTTSGIASNIITTSSSHNYASGDQVTYSKNGGTANIGITEGEYFVGYLSATTLYLYNTAANAIAGGATGRQSLTSTGSETHLLDPIRYVPASATASVGASNVEVQISMITDIIATG